MPEPAELPPLTPDEYRRYGRHLTLPEVGETGQRRLKASSALVIGAGGLGCPAAVYLAAAGVGRITICDFDVVDASNLQRQVLYAVADLGRPKAEVAAERLRALNPHLEIGTVDARVSSENVQDLVDAHDVVIDGSDNFTTRYLVSDACVIGGKPYVYGSIFRFEGQAAVFDARIGPCYRCLFPEPPPPGLVPNCAQAGVLGVLPGIIGSLQATEALKVLLEIGETLAGRLLLVSTLDAGFREVRLGKDPGCPVCGPDATIHSAVESAAEGCAPGESVPSIEPSELAELLAGDAPPFLLDVRESWEHAAGSLPESLNVPLGDVPLRSSDVPSDASVVVYCRVGPRGRRAVELLVQAGVTGARNLRGGLLAWREAVDPDLVVA